MRDAKGNYIGKSFFPANTFKNNLSEVHDYNSSSQGIWSVKDKNYDASTGVSNVDPYFNYVEFILRFEDVSNYNFANSINKPHWFVTSEIFGKSGKIGGYSMITSERSKFGTSCLKIGTTSNISEVSESLRLLGGGSRALQVSGQSITRSSVMSIGRNDFTMEGWIYLTSLNQGTSNIFLIQSKDQNGVATGFRLAYDAQGNGGLRLCSQLGHTTLATSSSPSVLNVDQWMHIAMVRKSGTIRVFVNGNMVLESSSFPICHDASIELYGAPTGVTLGTFFADETRFTNGIARYWNNFVPPSTSFYTPLVSGNSGLCLSFNDNDQRNSINPILKDINNKNIWIATNGVIKSTLNGKFTVTIASPAIFTKTQHGLQAGDTITLSTSGSLPTGLSSSTTYYVISDGLTFDTFKVSTTLNGSAINTSNTQSGEHLLSVTSTIQPVSKFSNSLYSSSHASFFHLSPDTVPNNLDFNLSFWMKCMSPNGNLGGSVGIDEESTLFSLNRMMSLKLAGDSTMNKSGGSSPNKGRLRFYINNILVAQTNLNVILRDTWYHIHISRNSTTYRIFINGTQAASATTTLQNLNKRYLMIGCNRPTQPVEESFAIENTEAVSRFNGYIEDFNLNVSTGLTTVQIPTNAMQPQRIIY
jgi:hypothetical protein